MSDNKPEILTTDDEKNNHYNIIVPYLNEADNQLRFKTPVRILTSMNGHFGLWSPNWKKVHDINLCTHTDILLKNDLEILLDTDIDDAYKEILPSIFTDADKAAFLIHIRKVRGNSVVSDIAPGIELDTIGHLWAKVNFVNRATPNSKEAPANNFIFYETYIGLQDMALAEMPFSKGNVTSSSRHQFVFTEAEVGKTMYVRCYYQITKGDRSPSSAIISFPII